MLSDDIPKRLYANPENHEFLSREDLISVSILYYDLLEGVVKTKATFSLIDIINGTIMNKTVEELNSLKEHYTQIKDQDVIEKIRCRHCAAKWDDVETPSNFSKFNEVIKEYCQAIDDFCKIE